MRGEKSVPLSFLMVMAVSLLIPSISEARERYDFLFMWPPPGPILILPFDVAVDTSGNVYVATGVCSIQKLDTNGNVLTKWGTIGPGDGQFHFPGGIAVDTSGNVYVADTHNNRIQKFTSEGLFLTKWGTIGFDFLLIGPEGIAVDTSGNVYVTDFGHRIQKFTSDGVFLTKWGTEGKGDGQFDEPKGIAVDTSGNVYVADSENHRIQKFTSDGLFLAKWGTEGKGDGQFSSPSDIAVDTSGNVYVADDGNHRIQEFTSDGLFLAKWGTEGKGDGQFYEPKGIAVDTSGNVYVADTSNNRIQKFTKKLKTVDKRGEKKWVKSSPTFGAQQLYEELEALDALVDSLDLPPANVIPGFTDSLVMNAARMKSLSNLLEETRGARGELVNYWAQRMLDTSFAESILDTLEQSPALARKAAELRSAEDVYRKLSEVTDAVRVHVDIKADEKIDLVRRADVPGRLRKVKRIILYIFWKMGYLDPKINPEWAPVYQYLKRDLVKMADIISRLRDRELETLSVLDDVYQDAIKLPLALEAACQKVKLLQAERDSALLLFLDSGPSINLSMEFLKSDSLWNAYLDAVIAYDEEVIRLFSMKEVKEDQGMAQDIYGLFDIRESVGRIKALLKGGRQLLSANLQHEIAEMCIAGDRWRGTDNLIYQAWLYASVASGIDPSNKAVSDIMARADERLRELDPQKFTARDFIRDGFDYAVAGDYQNALETFVEGRQAHPDNDFLHEWHVVVSYALSDLKAAERVWREKHYEADRVKVTGIAYSGLTAFAKRAVDKSELYASLKHYSLAYKACSEFKDYNRDWVFKEQKYLRGKIFQIYKKLPLKPAFPDLARRYAIEAQEYLEQGEGYLALKAYERALEIAPWWPEGYYNSALIRDAINPLGASPLAVWEMAMYLEGAPNGVYARKAKQKLQTWKRAIQ